MIVLLGQYHYLRKLVRPLKDSADIRLKQNQDSLTWFTEWEKDILNDQSRLKADKGRALFSSQCREDLVSCILGFEELCKLHWQSHPGASIIPARANSDVVENIFSQQRGLHNGAATNPNYFTYQKTMNSIILGQNTISKKSNTGASTAAEPFVFQTDKPLNPSKRKATCTVSSSSMKTNTHK